MAIETKQKLGAYRAVRQVYAKYATFSGRARPAEFWWFWLYGTLVGLALIAIDFKFFSTSQPFEACGVGEYVSGAYAQAIGDAPGWCLTSEGGLNDIFNVVNFVPSLAVTSRRLHDVECSFWWFLLIFLPVIGWIILFVMLVTSGTPGDNRFGPDPVTTPAAPTGPIA